MSKNKNSKSEPFLNEEWSDRKRILGMPISFTRYSVTDGRLLIKQGLFSTRYDEVMLYRINDIQMTEKFWQKLFNVGTITAYTSDASSEDKRVYLINIKNPLKIRNMLSQKVEDARDEKRVHSAEFIGPTH